MRVRYLWMGTALAAASVLSQRVYNASAAAPQSGSDRDARAREYVQFLVQQLDQWTRDLPQAYNMAMMRPPVDLASLSENEKAGAGELRASVQRLASVKDPEFRTQLEKTLQAAAPVNAALGKQRFPEGIESDWAQIRTTLNSLAGIYKYPELAVLEVPAPGSGRSGVKAAIPAGAITGYVVDQRCATSGKSMWANPTCVQKCVRDGDRVVLVTEQGKVFQLANQDKVEAESYGQKVAVVGKTEGDVVTVTTLQIL